MASVSVSTQIEIDRPISEVAAFAVNPDNAPLWYENIKSVEWKSEPPMQVGSEIAFVAHFLGRRLVYTYQIIEWLPSERLVMRTSEGPFPMQTTYLCRPLGPRRAHMTLRNDGAPKGFSRLVAPFMSMAMRRANQKDLARLNRVLEQRK